MFVEAVCPQVSHLNVSKLQLNPLSLFQARNSYSNEVVAIKKMSYNGKQTTEVRKTHTHTHTHAHTHTLNFVFKTIVPLKMHHHISVVVSPNQITKKAQGHVGVWLGLGQITFISHALTHI